MKIGERIPIHDHSGFDSGGIVAASTVVRLAGSEVISSGSTSFESPVATGTALSDGSSGNSARADHVHTNAYLGTVAVSGTAVADYVLTAQGAGSATWAAAGTAAGGGGTVVWYDEGTIAGTASIVNVTGSGGTVSVAGGTATIDISASGSSKYDPAASPTTATSVGVEYDDGTHNSFVWAASDPATNDVTTYSGYGHFAATDTAERWYSKAWVPGAGDITIAARFSASRTTANNAIGCGIYVGDATGDDPSNAVLLQVNTDATSLFVSAYNRNTGSFAQIGSSLDLRRPPSVSGFVYLRMTRTTGPVWQFFYSLDGIGWQKTATDGSKALTIGAIGLRLDSYSNASTAVVDFIRGWTSALSKIGS